MQMNGFDIGDSELTTVFCFVFLKGRYWFDEIFYLPCKFYRYLDYLINATKYGIYHWKFQARHTNLTDRYFCRHFVFM